MPPAGHDLALGCGAKALAIKSGKTNPDGMNLLIEGHKKRTHPESFLVRNQCFTETIDGSADALPKRPERHGTLKLNLSIAMIAPVT